ncbi:MAG: hypothetical protein M3063_13765 [Actinomycetota bacterium]|nr:hypothetical protein [Actinomycetota bacterium]MDQ6945529.1 hypothetical protein [Actinomycetota bacterium]
MEKRPPDLAKLLESWMEWERGHNPPGRTLADLKIAGMREILEGLVAELPVTVAVQSADAAATESWTPVV